MIFQLRCYFCEVLVNWAIKVCPKGYVPSFIDAVVDAEGRGRERERSLSSALAATQNKPAQVVLP